MEKHKKVNEKQIKREYNEKKAETKEIKHAVKTDISRMIFLLLPKRYRNALEREAHFADLEDSKEKYAIKIIAFFYLFFLIFFSILYFYFAVNTFFLIFILVAAIILGLFSPLIIFTLLADRRGAQIDAVLSDFLLLTASNIKSGFTIDKSLFFSARPEFGLLSEQIKRAAFEIYSGVKVEEAFSHLTEKIRSVSLERTFKLLLEGIQSGGNVATLLEESALDIENTRVLQKEIRSSVQMYVIFIMISSVIAAPILFAISNYLIVNTVTVWANLDINAEMSPQIFSSGILILTPTLPTLEPEFFHYFAISAIIITTVFGGILVSLIKTGEMKEGVKYSPAFLVISLIIFFVSQFLLSGVIGFIV